MNEISSNVLKLLILIVYSVLGPFVRSFYIFFLYKGYVQNHFNFIELDLKEIFIIYFSIGTIYMFLRTDVLASYYNIVDTKAPTIKEVAKKMSMKELECLYAFLLCWLLTALFL